MGDLSGEGRAGAAGVGVAAAAEAPEGWGECTSPSASLVYAHRLRNVSDPDGVLEAEINRLAKRLCRELRAHNDARVKSLRMNLFKKCMKFFVVEGADVSAAPDAGVRGVQVDEIFVEALMKVIDAYDANKGEFTHMLRNKFGYMRKDEAKKRAREDHAFGGQAGVADSLDALRDVHDEASGTRGDGIAAADAGVEGAVFGEGAEVIESRILLKMLSLVNAFLGNSGKAANETRKLYTKMFSSEMLTRAVKTRTEGELGAFEANQQELFCVVELAFQDYYTAQVCRTVAELWRVEFAPGVPEVKRLLNDGAGRADVGPSYSWRLPAAVYVGYLEACGRSSSGVLVSQQRKKYDELLSCLKRV